MIPDVRPARELTKEEKLAAALVELRQRIPSGFQLGMPMHLDRAMALVESCSPSTHCRCTTN